MLAYCDPPDDEEFLDGLSEEVWQRFGGVSGRPSLAVVCGGQEIEEQAAMFGLPKDRWQFPVLDGPLRSLVESILPGVHYVRSTPTGGDPPFRQDTALSHYFSVGSYLKSIEDPRHCGARFVSEGLAFANPPETSTVESFFGGSKAAGHDPAWKRAVHHDSGRSWDLEDFRDHYVAEIFGVSPALLRYHDPDRALDFGRATVAHLFGRVAGEWRTGRGPCRGFLTVALSDLAPGAGWGLIDSEAIPKSPMYALARQWQQKALILTYEGTNGIFAYLANDDISGMPGSLRVSLFTTSGALSESVEPRIEVSPRSVLKVDLASLFDGFRDLSYAYRFGPNGIDAVYVDWLDPLGETVAEA